MILEFLTRGLTFAGDQALEDRDMLAEHQLDLFGVEMALEGVMRRKQRKLAALYRIVEQAVWAREDSIDVKVALEPFQLCGRRLAALHAPYSLPLRAKVGAIQIREGLIKRDRLQEPAQFEMLTHLLGRQRSRIPAPVSILRHETDAIELCQHFMRHGAADAVIFREQALIELEAAILPEARDNMLDLGVDPCAAVAGGGFERFGIRQGQARFNQVEPARRDSRVASHHQAAPLEALQEALVLETPQGRGSGNPAGLESARDRRLAENEPPGKRFIGDLSAQVAIDHLIERQSRGGRFIARAHQGSWLSGRDGAGSPGPAPLNLGSHPSPRHASFRPCAAARSPPNSTRSRAQVRLKGWRDRSRCACRAP